MPSEELENAEAVSDTAANLEQEVTVAKPMQSEEQKNVEVVTNADAELAELVELENMKPKIVSATQVVTAEFVQAEEVPTIPIASLQAISTLQPEISVYSVASTRAVSIPSPLVVQPTEYRRSLREWVQIWLNGTRLNYLSLSLMPILLGSVLAWLSTITAKKPFGSFHIIQFLGTLVVVSLLQVGAHLVNDYYDFLHGVDTSNALGPGGLIQQGHIKPTRVLEMGLLLLGLGTALGLVLAINGGVLLYLFGLIVVLCAFFYSAGSYSLSSRALGEFAGFAIFGPILTLGAYMVQVGPHFPASVFIYSLPVGLLAVATLHANNMRDIEGDALAGKHTLASLVGLFVSRVLYLFLVLGAYGIILYLGIPHKGPHLILITLWTLPTLIIAIIGAMRANAPAGFHLVLALDTKARDIRYHPAHDRANRHSYHSHFAVFTFTYSEILKRNRSIGINSPHEASPYTSDAKVLSLAFPMITIRAIYKLETLCYTSDKVFKLVVNTLFAVVSQGGALMAGWEEELAVLLSELGVKQEEPQAHLQQARKPLYGDVQRREQLTDALFWGEDNEIDDDSWINDLDMMRREVDSIVSQVILLMQRGDLDTSLKEDVMVVLRALRRRLPTTRQSATASSDEAYLESASAMLHFCRLILQLSEFATEDF